MRACSYCSIPQPTARLISFAATVREEHAFQEVPTEVLICFACWDGSSITVPQVGPVRGKPGRVKNALGQEFDAEDNARYFETLHGACDRCHLVVPERELNQVWLRVRFELEPIALCRSCTEQCVFVPDDDWQLMRARDQASRWVRQVAERLPDGDE